MRPDTSSLRFVGCGAAPASAELLTGFETRYGVPVVEGYGLPKEIEDVLCSRPAVLEAAVVKRPRAVWFEDALPKNAVDKIVKGPLRDRLLDR
ncbi:hypothetical protein [Nonomuraea sediminis]|uniref:hypothetical protein n=1 Tax=Nonomuraea sediminis TaxID=2835864 RepID=UPI001BDC435A|nr:hypothetical protein [Nonomuraea sediminis]